MLQQYNINFVPRTIRTRTSKAQKLDKNKIPTRSVFLNLFTTTDHLENLQLVMVHLNYLKDFYLSIFHTSRSIKKHLEKNYIYNLNYKMF